MDEKQIKELRQAIIDGVDFTMEGYERIRVKKGNHFCNFDDFIDCIVDAVVENGGTAKDGVFIAENAMYVISKF